MTHTTRRLTAKNWDQLWNPILGNQVWAPFTFTSFVHMMSVCSSCALPMHSDESYSSSTVKGLSCWVWIAMRPDWYRCPTSLQLPVVGLKTTDYHRLGSRHVLEPSIYHQLEVNTTDCIFTPYTHRPNGAFNKLLFLCWAVPYYYYNYKYYKL